jgi:hypothetical protein
MIQPLRRSVTTLPVFCPVDLLDMSASDCGSWQGRSRLALNIANDTPRR